MISRLAEMQSNGKIAELLGAKNQNNANIQCQEKKYVKNGTVLLSDYSDDTEKTVIAEKDGIVCYKETVTTVDEIITVKKITPIIISHFDKLTDAREWCKTTINE